MKKFTADFETATWVEDETWVWAWAICEIGNEKNLQIGKLTKENLYVFHIEKQWKNTELINQI